jgi:cell division protein FtsX
VQRLGALHGLFAAFAAGCLMAIVIVGLNLAFGGMIDLWLVGQTFMLVVNSGALLALPLALLVAALAGWVRRARRASSSRRTANAALLKQLLTDR